jgi:hypothetical protein
MDANTALLSRLSDLEDKIFSILDLERFEWGHHSLRHDAAIELG